MERYVHWFASLHRFYQTLVSFALFVGLTALGTAIATNNPVYFGLAVFWLLVAPAVVWLASSLE